MLVRQGDIFIQTTTAIPTKAKPLTHTVLAEGELTGHSHRITEADSAHLYSHNSDLFLDIRSESATVIHDEHGPIELPRGIYRVWRQREYTPQAIRWVQD